MKFVDEVDIEVHGGHGGKGAVSFEREKYRPLGGPNGGNGGRGGDLIIEARSGISSLSKLAKEKVYKAENGDPGSGGKKSGADGKNLTLYVPIGTEIIDIEKNIKITDLNKENFSYLLVKGGLGGLGNYNFATSVKQTPYYAQPGLPGEVKHIKLNLKLIADAGLVGMPNSGKSTLLSVVSGNQAEIGDYPFTTLTPNLGVLIYDNFRRLILADIPGLIEGASHGAGLGISFLRHIERVKVIIYLLNADAFDFEHELTLLQNELNTYNTNLLKKPALVVINKFDLVDYDDEIKNQIINKLSKKSIWKNKKIPEIIFISAKYEKGLKEFLDKLILLFPEPTKAEEIITG